MNAPNATGTEDGYVALAVTVDKASPAGILKIEISGVPFGATLGTNNGGYTSFAEQGVGTITTVTSGSPVVTTYTYTLAEANLANLAISPPDDFREKFLSMFL